MALVLLVVLGIDWATGYAIAGYCMTHGVKPYGYAFWQSFGPFLLLLIIQVFRKDLWLDKQGMIYALLCALAGIVFPNLLIYYAVSKIPSGLLTVIANLSPVFTCILAWSLKAEKFSLIKFVWVLLGLFGVAIIIMPSGRLITVDLGSVWVYIALLIPFSYAFSAVYIAKFHPGNGSVLCYAMWMLLFSSLIISPLTVINQGYYELIIHDLNSLLILCEILLSTLGYVLLFIIINKIGAVSYTLVNAVAAVSGVIYGIVLGQHLQGIVYFAVFLIILAIAGLIYTQKR